MWFVKKFRKLSLNFSCYPFLSGALVQEYLNFQPQNLVLSVALCLLRIKKYLNNEYSMML